MRKLKQLRSFEVFLSKQGFGPVAGVDEAGRGACCGPITIAACILPEKPIPDLDVLTDSKKLSPSVRARLFPLIQQHAVSFSIVHIDAQEIDRLGIQWANITGMRRAVAQLSTAPGYVLTDAMKVPGLSQPHLPIIGGDASARCIAAASVLAKHSRDLIMDDLDARYPGYGLASHKGYGTNAHMQAVRRQGACPEHRYTYANVSKAHAAWLGVKRSDTHENEA